jgi:hypothetical protein
MWTFTDILTDGAKKKPFSWSAVHFLGRLLYKRSTIMLQSRVGGGRMGGGRGPMPVCKFYE